jgi:trehalose 6-phosphate phosphatase
MTRGAGRPGPAANSRGSLRPNDIELDRASLFLDLDGTLAPIAPTPRAVILGDDQKAIVRRAAQALDGRVAVISGRTVEEVDRILGPGLPCVAGVHGLQRRAQDGKVDTAQPHPDLEEARRVFRIAAQAERRLLFEEKGLSVALHYRQAPGIEAAVHEISEHLTERTGLILQKGDMVAELKTPGPDKGDAIRAFMAEPPFAGAAPVFVGDDLTDEAGFAAARDLGGFGILVGPKRRTLASMRLADPQAVLGWIEKSLNEGVFRVERRS